MACDEGEMTGHLRSDDEEGELRCSERVGVSVENGYYGSVRAGTMLTVVVRFDLIPSGSFWFLLVPSGWRQVRGVEMVGDSEGRVERSECDGVRSVCTCWTRELGWIILSV